jgi:hypothetical protein
MNDFNIEMLKALIKTKTHEINDLASTFPLIDKHTQSDEWRSNCQSRANSLNAIELAERLIDVLNR